MTAGRLFDMTSKERANYESSYRRAAAEFEEITTALEGSIECLAEPLGAFLHKGAVYFIGRIKGMNGEVLATWFF